MFRINKQDYKTNKIYGNDILITRRPYSDWIIIHLGLLKCGRNSLVREADLSINKEDYKTNKVYRNDMVTTRGPSNFWNVGEILAFGRETLVVTGLPAVLGAMDSGQKSFKLVWRCHQLLSWFLAKGSLP